jgi:hypothetical protein
VVREHRLAPWLAAATVCLGMFLGQLDASAVTLAFPAPATVLVLWLGLPGAGLGTYPRPATP